MPRVHVQLLSQFDRLKREKEFILTIPGSYWLCHKKNIYKFIFRYHRTMKDTIQFLYGRELLNIIRKIIKCHPCQGQQFGTQHLLVTYNCTSWTRQDKMFALLKFQQRINAAAFSHAFILTIKICPLSEESLSNMRYPIVKEADADATFGNLNVSLDSGEKITKSVTCTIDKLTSRKIATPQMKKLDEIPDSNVIDTSNDISIEMSEATVNSNFRDNIVTISIDFENPDTGIENAATPVEARLIDKHNTQFRDNIHKAKSEKSSNRINAKHSIDATQEKSLACNRINEIKIKDAEHTDKETKLIVTKKLDKETSDTWKYTLFSATEGLTGITKCDVNEWSLPNRYNFVKDSMKRSNVLASTDKSNSDDKKMTSIDSIDVPCQYFIEKDIEKEIENAKDDISVIEQPMRTSSQTTIRNINEEIPKIMKTANDIPVEKKHCRKTLDLKSMEDGPHHSDIQTSSSHVNQPHNNMYIYKPHKTRKRKNKDAERKTVPEDKPMRSSNITDLVMGGLMFTFKRDKDSIAVIEQKTKLEVDEVLENSEKVETKAGEKCLLNSSLLRLENLVTMIDSPRERRNKTGHVASGNSAHLLPLHTFSNGAIHDSHDTNYAARTMDKPNVFSHNRHDTTDNLTDPHLYRSRRHQRVSSSDNNDNTNLSSSGNTMKRDERLMERQDSESEQNKKNISAIKAQITGREKKCEEKEDTMSVRRLSSVIFPEKANTELQNADLFMNDVEDVKQTNKYAGKCSESTETCTMEISTVLDKRGLQDVAIKKKPSIPRIISSKAITVQQMPPALQKALHHKYRTRRYPSATISSEALRHDGQVQHSTTGNAVSDETSVLSLKDQHAGSNIANRSVKIMVDSKEVQCDKNESGVTIDKDNVPDMKINKNASETDDRHTYARRNTRRHSSSESHRFLQRNSTLKHGSPKKLQDITEDFYYDLMQHTHNKDNSTANNSTRTTPQRCLRQRRRSLDNPDDIKKSKVCVEMLKFIQDITEGVRVVVKRLDMNNKSELLKKNSALTTCTDM